MTKTDLIAQVAANTEMSKKSAEMAVNAAFEALGKAMAEVRDLISGFGTSECVSAPSVRASTPTPTNHHHRCFQSIVFKPSKALKDTL